MSGDNEIESSGAAKIQPGFCSATAVDRESLREEIRKPEIRTSDKFITCNLPKRFDHPHWFNGYGCQVSKQHPFYRTSASEYGWYPPGESGNLHTPPSDFKSDIGCTIKQTANEQVLYRLACWSSGIHTVPSVFFPAGQTFTNRLSAAGMYRNYSLNTGMDRQGY